MITSAAQVKTCASACLCLDASERTSESVSCAAASIRFVILPRSQVAQPRQQHRAGHEQDDLQAVSFGPEREFGQGFHTRHEGFP